MKLSDIAEYLGINFDGLDFDISNLNTLESAKKEHLSFFQNIKYLEDLKTTKAGVVLINEKYLEFVPENTVALVSEQPYLKLAQLTKLFANEIPKKDGNAPKIGENSNIQNVNFGKDVIIGNNVTIMSGAYIGDDVLIADNTLIYPNVTIYPKTKIGQDVIIHANSVIGSDGFGFAHNLDGTHVKIHHLGNVIIEDDVEIGSNVSIDKGVFGSTVISKGTKIDNLVQVAHNCQIGENTLITAQCGLAGSSKLGRNVVMGAQSGSAGHLEIGDFAMIAARGGVTKSLDGAKTYAGFPAIEHKTWLKKEAKLSKMAKQK